MSLEAFAGLNEILATCEGVNTFWRGELAPVVEYTHSDHQAFILQTLQRNNAKSTSRTTISWVTNKLDVEIFKEILFEDTLLSGSAKEKSF